MHSAGPCPSPGKIIYSRPWPIHSTRNIVELQLRDDPEIIPGPEDRDVTSHATQGAMAPKLSSALAPLDSSRLHCGVSPLCGVVRAVAGCDVVGGAGDHSRSV
jgi:hypothetical protein